MRNPRLIQSETEIPSSHTGDSPEVTASTEVSPISAPHLPRLPYPRKNGSLETEVCVEGVGCFLEGSLTRAGQRALSLGVAKWTGKEMGDPWLPGSAWGNRALS